MEKFNQLTVVKVDTVAQFLDLSPRMVQNLVANEGLPRIKKGDYDLIACVHWYIRYCKKDKDGDLSLELSKAKKVKYEASLKKLELQKKRGELLDLVEVRKSVSQNVKAVRDAFLNFPDRVSPVLASGKSSAEIHNILETEIRTILHDLSSVHESVTKKVE